jgi:O-antigen ligase
MMGAGMGMETSAPAAAAPPPDAATRVDTPRPQRIENRIGGAVLALVPAGLIVYFGFNGGGFFPGTVGFACVIVIQLLIVRVLLADHPFAGFSRAAGAAGLLLLGFAAWVLASGLWSDAEDRALIEFDRALLYVLVFVLFAISARTHRRFPWMVRGVAVAALVCCGVGLVSRLFPHAIPTTASLAVNRLAYPLTYWNALGMLAAVGLLLFLGLGASRGEPRLVRALAAGAIPILAVTLYFTFSRGAILAIAIGLVVFVLAARSVTLPGLILATVPPTLVALLTAYHADQLASESLTSPEAISQGRHVAVVVAICAAVAIGLRAALLALDDRFGRIESTPERRRLGRTLVAAGAVVLVVALIAAGAPGWVSDRYNGFFHGPKNAETDLRVRLTDPSSNGRVEHWRAALKEFRAEPARGSGAGTYEYVWHKRRHVTFEVVDAHSLYIEVLGELGVVGIVLLAGGLIMVIGGVGRGALRRTGGRNRVLYAAALAAMVAWAVQAGVDWLWEMPAVTAWVFALGGAALAARSGETAPGPPAAQRSRIPIAAALVVVAALPASMLFSQSHLQAAARAFGHGRCKDATDEAFASINQLSLRPEPYRIIGYCDLEQGRPVEAVAAMRKAVHYSPRNWESHFGLSLALGAAGRDPRPEIGIALGMNPREGLLQSTSIAFSTAREERWQRAAAEQMRIAFGTGLLTFK